ncbi:hypothetical protein llg_23690 [Luteolibacter sp. LG18]|nr:hypothetical protein llg_23690 [Luteolibacter sp. LG18]
MLCLKGISDSLGRDDVVVGGVVVWKDLLEDVTRGISFQNQSDSYLRFLEKLDGGDRPKWVDSIQGSVLGRMLSRDSTTALESMKGIDNMAVRAEAEKLPLQNMARVNPDAASAFYLSSESFCARDAETIHALFPTVNGAVSERTIGYISSAPPSIRRDWLVCQVVQDVAIRDPDAALAYLDWIGDEGVKKDAAAIVARERKLGRSE